jgi:hypothetical protein
MLAYALTHADSRLVTAALIDEIYRDREGEITAFGLYVGDDAHGRHLFVPYVHSYDSHSPQAQIGRAFRDLLTGANVIFGNVVSHGNKTEALMHGPNAMRASAVKGFRGGFGKAALAIMMVELVAHVVKHIGRPHFYVPADGSGPVFTGPIYLR